MGGYRDHPRALAVLPLARAWNWKFLPSEDDFYGGEGDFGVRVIVPEILLVPLKMRNRLNNLPSTPKRSVRFVKRVRGRRDGAVRLGRQPSV